MKFNAAAAAFTAAFLAGGAYAEDQQVINDESSTASVAAESSASAPAELPTFTVSTTELPHSQLSSARASELLPRQHSPAELTAADVHFL